MGRHPLTVPDPGPIPISRLLFVVVVAAVLSLPVPVVAAPQPSAYDLDLEEEEFVNPKLGELEVETLKGRILEGLGLTRAPDASKMNVSQDEYERMYGVYLRSVEENRRRRQAEMEHERVGGVTAQRFYSFTHAGHQRERIPRDVRKRHITWLYFPLDIPEVGRGQQVEVEHSTLRLFVSGLHPDEAARDGNTVEVRVYQVLQPDHNRKSRITKESRQLVDERRIYLSDSGSKWTEFDVTKAAESWVNGGASNLGLEVECRECVRRGITLVTQETEGSNSSVSPVLNILADVHVSGRQKRSSDPLSSTHRGRTVCPKNDKARKRCCLHSMQVVFKDLEGFGFILQPQDFDAGYCKGRCPPRYNPAHHHALLQSLIWKQDRGKAPRPCCAPSKLVGLEILHLDEQDHTKLKVSNWKNIKVAECACS